MTDDRLKYIIYIFYTRIHKACSGGGRGGCVGGGGGAVVAVDDDDDKGE